MKYQYPSRVGVSISLHRSLKTLPRISVDLSSVTCGITLQVCFPFRQVEQFLLLPLQLPYQLLPPSWPSSGWYPWRYGWGSDAIRLGEHWKYGCDGLRKPFQVWQLQLRSSRGFDLNVHKSMVPQYGGLPDQWHIQRCEQALHNLVKSSTWGSVSK